MTRGAQEALSQAGAPSSPAENAQLKEELAFLQKLVSDSSKTVGLAIQRLAVEPDGDDMWRYSVLIVRGGSPKDEFVGNVDDARHAAAGDAAGRVAHPRSSRCPTTSPGQRAALRSNSSIISGLRDDSASRRAAAVTAVAVRAFESGQAMPRATRTLSFR